MKIDEAAAQAWQSAEDRGWHDRPRSFGDEIAMIHSELSEAVEAFREDGHGQWFSESGKPEGTLFELADAVIRIMDTAENLRRQGSVSRTLGQAIAEKMAYNTTRPYRHGGKRL